MTPDERLLRVARTAGHTPAAERWVARFSSLGEHGAIWLAIGAGGALVDRPRAARWLRSAGVIGGAYVLNTVVKLVVRRPRPQLADLPPLSGTPTQLSFPSSHAVTSFCAAAQYRRLGVPAAPLYALACALAASRLYLGVHWPSDVLAGAALGALAGELAR